MTTLFDRLRSQARQMPPTRKHRPIITFGILGTVYGISPEGEVKYFDYDWDGALAFAGVAAESLEQLDPRIGKPKQAVALPGCDMWHPERLISSRDRAYWVL